MGSTVMVLVLLRDDAPTPASRALVMLQDTEYRGTKEIGIPEHLVNT